MHGEKVCKNEVCKLFALRDGTVTWSMLEISSEKKNYWENTIKYYLRYLFLVNQ